MPQTKPLTDRALISLLQGILLESANYSMVQSKLAEKFGVYISATEWEKMINFYQLFQTVKQNQNTL